VTGRKGAEEIIDELYQLILERNNEYKDSIEEGRKCKEFSPKLFIINSIRTLTDNKDDIRVQKLDLALEKGSKNYNVNFIIFDEVKRLSIVTKKAWYKEHIKTENGIWIGRGFA